MVFGIKNGLTFESQYILSTMNASASSGNTESLPVRININAFENTQSSDGQQGNQLPNMHQTNNSNLRTPMRVQVEYPDNISRKRKHQFSNNVQQPLKKINPVNSMAIIEQFREECLEDDVLLSQIADVQVNDEPNETDADNDGHFSLGLSDTARVFARCFSLPKEKSAKKGKVLVYDSDGLVDDSD